jgi:putative tryptophan/tyrosine transport system substrate-binding protein
VVSSRRRSVAPRAIAHRGNDSTRSMDRRQFLRGIALLALAPAFAAQGQGAAGRSPHVGIFSTSPDVDGLQRLYVEPFLDQMRREFGWAEKVNIHYDRVYNEDRLRVPLNEPVMREKASTLIARKPDVIWVDSSISAGVILEQSSVIPVVGSAVSNTIGREWVEHQRRPGKNFTGVSNPDPGDMAAKRLEWLLELMPALRRVGLLTIPRNANSESEWKSVSAFAAQRRVAVTQSMMDRDDQAEAAFMPFRQAAVQAVLVAHHPLFQNHRKRLLELARLQKIPLVGTRTYFVQDGALLSYSTSLGKQMRRSALHVHKILKGEAPSEIPIDVFKEGELAVNLRAAEAFGLIVPESVRQFGYVPV